jgi:hypothetical protein
LPLVPSGVDGLDTNGLYLYSVESGGNRNSVIEGIYINWLSLAAAQSFFILVSKLTLIYVDHNVISLNKCPEKYGVNRRD